MNNFKKTTHDEIVIFKNLRFERSTACDLGQDGAIFQTRCIGDIVDFRKPTHETGCWEDSRDSRSFRCHLNNRVEMLAAGHLFRLAFHITHGFNMVM